MRHRTVRRSSFPAKRRAKLSASMSLAEFDNGYWYTIELKAFARSIGAAFAGGLRKDQLESHIRRFLETGEIGPPQKQVFRQGRPRDVDLGLRLDLPIVIYTNDRRTKEFLEKEARRMAPAYKRKSGARYRLNRWRESELAKGIEITYGDLVREYVRLSSTEGSFSQIPHGRYINFLSDFLRAERGATREQAIQAWKWLKTADAPKNYASWKRLQSKDE